MQSMVLLSLVLGLWNNPTPAQPQAAEPRHDGHYFRLGSDLEGLRPGDPIAGWQPYDFMHSVPPGSVFVLRKLVTLPELDESADYFAVEVNMLGAYEFYWDGRLVGKNGTWGRNQAEERPGRITGRFILPRDWVTTGEHLMGFRVSTQFQENHTAGTLFYVVMRPLSGFHWRDWGHLGRLVALGFCAPVSLFFLLLWVLADRRLPLLIFASLCLAVSCLLLAEDFRDIYNYPYPWHYWRLRLVLTLTALVSLLLLLFLLIRFRVPKGWYLWSLVALLTLAVPVFSHNFDGRAVWVMTLGLVAAQGVTFWALWQKKAGAWLTFAGVTPCSVTMLLRPFAFLDHLFFPTFCILIFCFLISLILEMRDRRLAHQRAQLNAARLEIELLKKHIQPHFLMNTLTSLMEWLEEAPQTAVKMVQALAEEFEVLNQISGEQAIPLTRELALCRAHLEVMGLRKDCRYTLQTQEVQPDALVPPAVFHTLIENGITHAAMPPGDVVFSLEQEQMEGGLRYRFKAPLPDDWQPPTQTRQGTGLAYIKMRLQETFPNRWRWQQRACPGYWETTIEIAAGASA